MRILLILILLSSSFTLKAGKFIGYYVTNNQDTISCYFNLADFDYYDLAGISKKVIIVDNEGVKKFKPHEIICFAIVFSEQEQYKFVSLKEDPKKFYHEIVYGKLSLYKTYSMNLYHGVPSITTVLLKHGMLFTLSGFNTKQAISELLIDNPAILAKWKKTKLFTDADTKIETIVREYNESFSNKER